MATTPPLIGHGQARDALDHGDALRRLACAPIVLWLFVLLTVALLAPAARAADAIDTPMRTTGAAHTIHPDAGDARCRLVHYRVGSEVVPVVYCTDAALWDYFPSAKPQMLTQREVFRGGDQLSLKWTMGIYDTRSDLIWIAARHTDDPWAEQKVNILNHELAHRDETVHGWDVARLRWLWLYYEHPTWLAHSDVFHRLAQERALGLTWGIHCPKNIADQVAQPVLIADESPVITAAAP